MGGAIVDTPLFVATIILVLVGGIIGFGGILASFCVPYYPYFDGKRVVTYSEIEDMRHLCDGVLVTGEVMVVAAMILMFVNIG